MTAKEVWGIIVIVWMCLLAISVSILLNRTDRVSSEFTMVNIELGELRQEVESLRDLLRKDAPVRAAVKMLGGRSLP